MVTWRRSDILANYQEIINYPLLLKLRAARTHALDRPHWQNLREALSRLPLGDQLAARGRSVRSMLSDARVTIGSLGDLTDAEHEDLARAIEYLIPWRKGPFSFFGLDVDTEWQSNLKWDRIASRLDTLSGKAVLDVGCGNGYYMFRAAALNPECIVGFDPSEAFFYAFELAQRFLQIPSLQYELLGSEDLHCLGPAFDVVLCLGVIYHQKDPLGLLQGLREVMKPGAQLILESQAVDMDAPLALCPPGRYAKARNVYFVPTASCLCAWLTRVGFREVEVFSSVPVRTDEQRATPFAPYESLSDFLDPLDPSKTVEGYPAPHRVAVHARR